MIGGQGPPYFALELPLANFNYPWRFPLWGALPVGAPRNPVLLSPLTLRRVRWKGGMRVNAGSSQPIKTCSLWKRSDRAGQFYGLDSIAGAARVLGEAKHGQRNAGSRDQP